MLLFLLLCFGCAASVSAPVATAKATTSSGAAVKTLKLGSTGAAVKKMQKALGLTEDGKLLVNLL